MRRLTILYDEGCGFCTELAAWLARRPRLEAAAIGSPQGAMLLRDLVPELRYDAVHVVDGLGRRRSGGAALAPVLRELPGCSIAATACDLFPGAAARGYRVVARNRALVSRLLRSSRALTGAAG